MMTEKGLPERLTDMPSTIRCLTESQLALKDGTTEMLATPPFWRYLFLAVDPASVRARISAGQVEPATNY